MNMMSDDYYQDYPFVPYPNNTSFNKSGFKDDYLFYMVSFSILLLLLVVIYFYVRYAASRLSGNGDTDHPLTLIEIQARDNHNPPPRITGLDPIIIASLPTFIVRTKTQVRSDDDNDRDDETMNCIVCLSDLENKERAKLLPNCNHIFHVGCIDMWLESHSTCPLCRAEVKPQLKPQDREGPLRGHVSSVVIDISALNSTNTLHGVDGDGEMMKSNGSNSRLSSIRRILSRGRSSTIQPSSHNEEDTDDFVLDLERQ